ncbi:uncharacterized protein LOC120351079 [Nilaparvata lugens]|uniref:uncharacterized protein LOC120351079 n=1 Tax=Nilaparvata lugens TaxID=108931 RepID=UPI00193C9991|nr:uncharacterized protein LOC120351079 [Nilaparvata lugens]
MTRWRVIECTCLHVLAAEEAYHNWRALHTPQRFSSTLTLLIHFLTSLLGLISSCALVRETYLHRENHSRGAKLEQYLNRVEELREAYPIISFHQINTSFSHLSTRGVKGSIYT